MEEYFGIFISGLFLGMLLGVLLIECRVEDVGTDLLNDPRYTIDTTVSIHNSDTTYFYKFIKQ